MPGHVLYFPFINVPNSSWFSRTLLYSDTVSAIIPYEFAKNPEALETHTRDLLRSELLHQVIPADFVCDIPNFQDAFAEYMDNWDEETLLTRQQSPEVARVFFAKVPDGIVKEMKHKQLIRDEDGPWLAVEKRTATDYMAYLAASIGQVRGGTRAVTDDRENLSPLLSPRDQTDVALDDFRMQLLSAALPTPRKTLPPRTFKYLRIGMAHCFPTFGCGWKNVLHISVIQTRTQSVKNDCMILKKRLFNAQRRSKRPYIRTVGRI